MVCNISDTLATHFGLVYDDTSAGCWVQNGAIYGCASVTFKHQFFNKQDETLIEKTCCMSILYSTPINT